MQKNKTAKTKILLVALTLTATNLLVFTITGCGNSNKIDIGKSDTDTPSHQTQTTHLPPEKKVSQDTFTKNTTRIAEDDSLELAGKIAQAVFPGSPPEGNPHAIVFVDRKDWRAALLSTSLLSSPVRAPTLLTEDGRLPKTTAQSVQKLQPRGVDKHNGVQAIAIDNAPVPPGVKVKRIQSNNSSYRLAQEIDRLQTSFHSGKQTKNVVIVSADEPTFSVPAAAWAAKSGDSILFVNRDKVPTETLSALRSDSQLTTTVNGTRTKVALSMYLLGPTTVISQKVSKALAQFGSVKRISGNNPTANAIAFAKYADGPFGWGITDPGHGLIFSTTKQPLSGILSASLSSSGTYGPLLLLERPGVLSQAVRSYLLDIQPGYQQDPVRGVYNHGWLIGSNQAIHKEVQAEIDTLLEIVPVKTAEKPTQTTPKQPEKTATTPYSTTTTTQPKTTPGSSTTTP